MSSWGNLDNVQIQGTVIVATANGVAVLGTGTAFTSNIKSGDYITIASNKYQVNVITSNTVLTLTTAAATNSVNVPAFVQQGPKYVSNVVYAGRSANLYTIQKVYGIDKNEAVVTENKNRNLKTPGWSHYNTYTGPHGVRHKGEALVAMSKNFNANLTLDLQTDADDDTVLADFEIVILSQPVNASNVANEPIEFVVVADSSPVAGESLTYQWYEDNTTHVYAIVDAGDYSGATTDTLGIANVSNVDGFVYFVEVSGGGGADTVTSDTATATEV